MAIAYTSIAANSPADAESDFDAALASILSSDITGFGVTVADQVRFSGTEIDILVTSDDSGGDITNPYKLKVFQGESLADVVDQLETFQAANPGYWLGAIPLPFYVSSSRGSDRVLLFFPYNEDATDGAANWAV